MHDLNDLYYFVQIVDHGGFAPASRVLGLPKSKLSRRIALLEERLGVRLIQRTSRHFSVTDIGQNYYAHCKAMLVEADAAQEAIDQTRSEPCGLVRLACPVALLHAQVGNMLADFLAENPRVELQLEATNRRVDVIAEGLDLAIRARTPPLEDSDLVHKVLGERSQCLIASPALIQRWGEVVTPSGLNRLPSLDLGLPQQNHVWRLEGPGGAHADIHHQPRLVTDDMIALRTAAIAGVGVVQLPTLMVSDEIRSGALVRLLPQWAPKRHLVHVVFASKRGLLPSVRALVDDLPRRFEQLGQE